MTERRIKTKDGEMIWYSDDFQCRPDCGMCCEDHIAFQPRLLKTHKKDMQRTVTREEALGDYVMLRTEDAMCVFLKPDKRCAIYKLRPVVCRVYGRHPKMQCPLIDSMGKQRDEQETFTLLEDFKRSRMERLKQGPYHFQVGLK